MKKNRKMKKTIGFISIFVLLCLNSWAHAGGFYEQCDKICLPNCTTNWNSVTATDSAFYVVGNAGNCFIYYHNGTVKSVNTGTAKNLTGVQFITNSIGFSWGTGGILLKTTDGGTSWDSITTNTSSTISKVQFIDENNGFIMAGSIISKTTNGGTTWAPLTLPGGISFTDFHFFDAQNGQLCGQMASPSLSGYLFKSTNGGVSWSQTYYNDSCAFTKLFYTNDSSGFLYGSTSSTAVLLQTNDSSAISWSVKYMVNGWSLGSDVVNFGGQTVFVANETSGIFMYGTSDFLSPLYGYLTNPINIYSAVVNGDSTLYVVAESGLYRYMASHSLAKQVDFGNNIIADTSNPYNFFVRGKKIKFHALLYNVQQDTIDSVQAIIKTSCPYITIYDSMATYYNVLSHYSAWSADDYGIIVSSNAPTNYVAHIEFTYIKRVPYAGTADKSILDLPIVFAPFTISSDKIVDTATSNTLGNGNGIIEPLETAQITPSVQNTSINSFYTITGYLFCQFPQIYIWNNMALPGGSGECNNNYSYGSFNPNDIMQPAGVFVFTDSFATTYKIPLTLVFKGTISSFLDTSGCYLPGYDNINYCWGVNFFINNTSPLPPDSLLSINVNSGIETLSNATTLSIYPNPNNGIFTVTTGGGTMVENGTIEVDNLLGALVYISKIEQNTPFKIDISEQPSGIYFLKMTSTTTTQKTIKILKN